MELPAVDLGAERGALDSDLVSTLEAQSIFQNSFRSMNYHFAWIDPAVVVSQQAFVKVRERPAITSANLMSVAFRRWRNRNSTSNQAATALSIWSAVRRT
jgi:hypothetical protein